jgi:hypothetical protein
VETKAHLSFFKKGRGALWVFIWNRGGGGPKKFGNLWSRAIRAQGLPVEMAEREVVE